MDDAGQLAYPPIGEGQIASRVIAVVALTPAILAVLLLGVGWVIRRLLDRRRMTSWASEWSAVEPLWTKRDPLTGPAAARLRPAQPVTEVLSGQGHVALPAAPCPAGSCRRRKVFTGPGGPVPSKEASQCAARLSMH